MRPPKITVEAAIREAKGGVSRAAQNLGCSRSTLYNWIYQLQLQDVVGIRSLDGPDSRVCQDSRDAVECEDSATDRAVSASVRFSRPGGPTLKLVNTLMAGPDLKIPATIRISEALWKRARKEAIDRGCTASQLTEKALAIHLEGSIAGSQPQEGNKP